VLLLDAAKGSIVAKLKLSSDGPGSGVEFSPSGETLAAGSYDTSICLWSMSKIVPKVTK
jgi:WD40 repeat protein